VLKCACNKYTKRLKSSVLVRNERVVDIMPNQDTLAVLRFRRNRAFGRSPVLHLVLEVVV
jgi:hypothetical protein